MEEKQTNPQPDKPKDAAGTANANRPPNPSSEPTDLVLPPRFPVGGIITPQ